MKSKFIISSTVGVTTLIYSVVTFFSVDSSGGEDTAPYVFASYIFIFVALPLTLYAIHLYRTRHEDGSNRDRDEKGGTLAVSIFLGLMVVFGAGALTMGWHGIESRKVKSFCVRLVGIAEKIGDVEAKAIKEGYTPKIEVDEVTDELSRKLSPSGRLTVMKTVMSVHFICGVYYEHGLVVKKGFYTRHN